MPDTLRTIGPYRLHDLVGKGGMGQVYRGTAPNGSRVAVKVLKPDLASHPEVRRRFTREARAAARLEHPHIVRLIDFGSDRGEYYIVMELVTGGSLSAWRDAPPDGETMVEVFDQVLRALGYAHSRGMIHRDLKPENVLLSFDDEGHPCAKVMDFGVVFFRDEHDLDISGIQALVGTPAYMAPEQGLNLADASPATDIYSVGVMLFELLTGARPFVAKSAAATVVAHIREPIPPVRVREGLTAEGDLDELMQRFLAKDPADRFMFAVDARRALDRLRLRGATTARREGRATALDSQDATLDEQALRTVYRPAGGVVVADPEPASAYRLFGLRDAPLEGRDDLLTSIRADVLDAMGSGRRGATLIGGEMGLGKTRLLRHLREALEEKGLAQVWVGSYDGRPEGPDSGFRQAIRRGLGISSLNPAEVRRRVGELLERVGVHDDWELDATCELLTPDQGVRDLVLTDDDATFALVGRTLQRAGLDRPVVLVLDDVHLGDGEAVRMLQWLLRAPRSSVPWYVVLTYRPQYLVGAEGFAAAMEVLRGGRTPGLVEVALDNLTLAETEDVVSSFVPLDPALARAIALRASGNPMVAVELLRHLVDSGRLEGLGDAPSPDELLVGIPTAVSALVGRRLDEAASSPTADEHTLDLWERFAFLGLRFDTALAREAHRRAAVDVHPPGADSLERAIDVGLLSGILVADDDDVLRFESGLVRDALLERAREDGRTAKLHTAAGDAKVSFFADSLPERAMEVARHYHLADDAPRAVENYIEAIRHAQAWHRQERVIQAWMAVAALAGGVGDPDALRLRAEVGIADAHLRLARFGSARQHALGALALARSVGLDAPVDATCILADVARLTGNLRESRDLYVELLERTDKAEAAHANAELGLGRLELRDGKLPAAERHFRAAREAFAGFGDNRRAAAVQRELAQTAYTAGLLDEARSLAGSARTDFDVAQDRRGVALCDLTLADVARAAGDLGAAFEHYTSARESLTAVGDWHGATLATLGQGSTTHDSDDPDSARPLLQEAERGFREIGDEHYAAIATLCLAQVDIEGGLWSLAEPRIEAALTRDRDERIDDGGFTGRLVDIARLALFGGRPALARTLLTTAAFKLERIADQSPLYDRVDEVQYLLAELGDDASLDEPEGVVDLFADDEPG